jgi:serine/threonine protein phosphatase 1
VPDDQLPTEARADTMQWMLYAGDAGGEIAQVDARHCSGKHIVHGHHQSASHPLLLPGRTNLDSYAWQSGRLAIGVFDDDVAGGPVSILAAIAE